MQAKRVGPHQNCTGRPAKKASVERLFAHRLPNRPATVRHRPTWAGGVGLQLTCSIPVGIHGPHPGTGCMPAIPLSNQHWVKCRFRDGHRTKIRPTCNHHKNDEHSQGPAMFGCGSYCTTTISPQQRYIIFYLICQVFCFTEAHLLLLTTDQCGEESR